MAKFEFDATEAIRAVTTFSSKVKQVGIELDALELSKALTTSVRSVDRVFEGLEASVKLSRSELDRLGTSFNTLRFTGEAAVTGIVAAQQKAYITLKAYTDQNNVLNKVLRDTDSKNIQISTTRTLNTLQEKAAADLAILSERTNLLSTAEGRSLAVAKELAKAKTLMATQGDRLKITLAQQTEQQKLLNDADAKAVANNRIIISALERSATAAARLAAEEIKLRTEKELGNSATAKNIAALKAEDAIKRQAATARQEELRYYEKKTSDVAKLRRELEYLNTAEAKQAAVLRQQISEQNRALTASTEATVKKARSLNFANQATAAMRASLAGLQTSFGMFTSSTIIAASATYAFMRAVRSTITVGAEFQATMARTQAIMGNSVPEAFRSDVFSLLEDQIRGLGKTTQFTATEVASAMTELGQAGLSVGEAMTALAPTLDLSIIGQLGMAQAADHVTNIMMIFNKEAKDLTHIVDVLAVAVTNSNTTIDQLANALTYAGPAAQSAGFSMEDTVASLEALANSGFKASRAGTALRRLFVSLANPTKKGQAVLDKLNVSVVDLEGKTLSLTGVIERLGESLEGLSDTEKLTAIQDLVGVYATSPVAALLSQAEALKHLRYQLSGTGDAASKMRKEIESALTFDFKTALSAFQEAQLSVFANMEQKLQLYTLQTAQWLTELTNPIRDDTTTTKLDVMIQRFEDLAKAAFWLGTAITASKLAPHLFTLQGHMSKAATATAVFSDKMKLQSAVANQQALALRASGGAAALASQQFVVASRTVGVLSGTMATATAVASKLTWLVSKGLGLLPWIGIAYTAYEVFNSFFGSRTEGKIKAQKAEIDSLALSYLQVKENIEAAALAEQRLTARKQIDVMGRSRKLLEDEKRQWEEVAMQAKTAGLESSRAASEIGARERAIEDLDKAIDSLQKQTQPGLLQSQSADTATLRQLFLDISAAQRSLEFLNSAQPGGRSIYAGGDDVEKAKAAALKNLNELQAQATALLNLDTDSQRTAALVTQQVTDAKLAGAAARIENGKAQNATDLEKYLQLKKEEAAAELLLNQELEKMADLKSKGKIISDGFVSGLTNLTTKFNQAADAAYAAQLNLDDFAKEAQTALDGIAQLAMTDEEKTAKLQKDLQEILELRAKNIQAILVEKNSSLDSIEAQAMLAESYKEQLRVMLQLDSFKKKGGSGGAKGESAATKALQQRLTAAKSLFDALEQQYDKVGVSQRKMASTTTELDFLLARSNITAEDHAKALQQLKVNHIAVADATNVHQVAAARIADTYLKSSNDKAIKDLVALEKAYKNTAMSAKAYELSKGAILKSTELKDLPETDLSGSNNTGPFGDMLSTVMTHSKTTKDLEEARDNFLLEYEQQQEFMRLREEAELVHAEKTIADEQARLEKMSQIRDNYRLQDEAKESIHKKGLGDLATAEAQHAADSQKLIMASMAGSLSSLLGMIGDASEDATTSQKIAFAASKALAVAQILLNTHVAASKANAELPVLMGLTMSQLIMAQGYASAGLVGALAIGQLSGSGGGDYAGAYDKGGYIPTGKYGIVGEYGPEIVNGPANVTGREETARKLNSGSDSGPQQVTIAPVIQIEYTSEGAGGTSQDAAVLGNAIKLVVLDTMRDQLRPNGILHRSQ